MKSELWHPVERLRRIWTPEREIYERFDSLEPSTELDSIIRELLSRTIQQLGSIQLDASQPATGFIRWEKVDTPTGKPVISVWWVPEPDRRNGDV